MESMVMFTDDFWLGKKVFLTGHTGFKGSWMTLWLNQLGAHVTGFALAPPTSPNLFNEAQVESTLQKHIIGDIRNLTELTSAIHECQPDVVIHMAAQSLVRLSYNDPVSTYSTNVMGTVHLLEAVRKTRCVKAILNITTDKCYENNEWVWGYRENEAMGGHDPYSNSKGCAELVSTAYRQSFFKDAGVATATARAGNVIGGGDWALDRIVPDAIRAFISKEPLMLRNPLATRPWQHVLEPLSGYLILCQHMVLEPEIYSSGWNFGPLDADAQPVENIANIMVKLWGNGASWALDDGAHPHEAHSLKLDCSKANTLLKWKPVWCLETALKETVNWYKDWNHGENMHEVCLSQIHKYQSKLVLV